MYLRHRNRQVWAGNRGKSCYYVRAMAIQIVHRTQQVSYTRCKSISRGINIRVGLPRDGDCVVWNATKRVRRGLARTKVSYVGSREVYNRSTTEATALCTWSNTRPILGSFLFQGCQWEKIHICSIWRERSWGPYDSWRHRTPAWEYLECRIQYHQRSIGCMALY